MAAHICHPQIRLFISVAGEVGEVHYITDTAFNPDQPSVSPFNIFVSWSVMYGIEMSILDSQ